MNREHLDHLIRAAGDLLNEHEVIVAGSQAALGQFPEGLPKSALLSTEVDLAAIHDPTEEKAWLINGVIGEETAFAFTFGYYAEGIGRELLVLPADWEERAVRIIAHGQQRDVTGICPEIHDLAVAKLAAGRKKDSQWASALIQSGQLRVELLLERATRASLRPDQERFIIDVVRGAGGTGRRRRKNVQRLTESLEGIVESKKPPDREI
jgi:hypothetical protein